MSGLARVGGFGERLGPRGQNLRYVLRFPRLVPKLALDYLRVLAGRRVLRGVEFAITYRCNFVCRHCLTQTVTADRRPELNRAEIADIALQIDRLGGFYINFTGGEPILRDDIEDIVADAAARRRLLVTLASNAYALTPEKLTALKKRGLAMLTLSLDGPDPEAHDRFRDQTGSFARVAATVGVARSLNLPVWLNAVATREALQSGAMARLADLARQWHCLLTLNLPYPTGGWRNEDVRLGDAEYRQYLELLRLPHVRWEGSSNWGREGCPAGVEKIYITPYGEVFPCAVLQTTYGNLREESLAAIYRRLGAEPLFDGRHKPCLVAEAPELLPACLKSPPKPPVTTGET